MNNRTSIEKKKTRLETLKRLDKTRRFREALRVGLEELKNTGLLLSNCAPYKGWNLLLPSTWNEMYVDVEDAIQCIAYTTLKKDMVTLLWEESCFGRPRETY